MVDQADKWNDQYAHAEVEDALPVKVVTDNVHLLPESGDALDLACGLGANALLLARHGLNTVAWDISHVAIEKLERYSSRLGLPLRAQVRDVVTLPPETDSFDVIVVARFLERKLAASLISALKPGGLLFYQTFTREKAQPYGPSNPDYTLAQNELLRLFASLRIIAYSEEGRIGDISSGFRNEAMLIAQKLI